MIFKNNYYLKSLRCAVRTTVLVSNRGFKRKIIRVESLLKKSIANSPFGLPAMIPAIIIDVLPIIEAMAMLFTVFCQMNIFY